MRVSRRFFHPLNLVWDFAWAAFILFWGMQRFRPLHLAWSRLTWTRYFERRFHDPQAKGKGRGGKLPSSRHGEGSYVEGNLREHGLAEATC